MGARPQCNVAVLACLDIKSCFQYIYECNLLPNKRKMGDAGTAKTTQYIYSISIPDLLKQDVSGVSKIL